MPTWSDGLSWEPRAATLDVEPQHTRDGLRGPAGLRVSVGEDLSFSSVREQQAAVLWPLESV